MFFPLVNCFIIYLQLSYKDAQTLTLKPYPHNDETKHLFFKYSLLKSQTSGGTNVNSFHINKNDKAYPHMNFFEISSIS